MSDEPTYGGWSPAMNRWLDQTGTCHYLKASPIPGQNVTVQVAAACGYSGYLGGITYRFREVCERMTGTHACQRCLAIEQKHPAEGV